MLDQELLKVEDHFLLTNVGLVVAPDFSVPQTGVWSDIVTSAKVKNPEGQEKDHEIKFGMVHFNIKDPKFSIDKRWRVVISFPNATKEQVPIGSKIFVSKDDYMKLKGENA